MHGYCCEAQQMPERNLPDPRILLDQATRLARAGELDKALELAGQLPASAVKFQLQSYLLTQRRRPGDLAEAEGICTLWQRAVPGSVQPLFQLMQLYWNTGRAKLTPPLANRITELEPGNQFTPYYRAISEQLNGNLEAALADHRLALQRNTSQQFSAAELDFEVAIAAYDVAAGHYPGSPGLNEDALVEQRATRELLESAIGNWQKSGPDFTRLDAGQITRYGNACYNLGCADANRYFGVGNALAHIRDALQIDPGHELASTNYLFIKNYEPEMSARDALELAENSTARFRRRLGPPLASWNNERDPERKLRVAYLSSDFRRHSVVHFITPVLEAHDHENVQVHAYYTGHRRDEWTERVAKAVDHFVHADRLGDRDLQRQIVQDRIDILVDLNGFTRGHRVGTVMRRAAPVQVSWIGYPSSTGMDVMDYRIVDAVTDPPPGAQDCSSEKLLYMDPVFSVYLPDPELPDVAAETPALKNGHVTFGSFNALPKLNPALLEMWGRILSCVDGSMLLVKNKMLDQPSVRRDVAEALAAAGIPPGRQRLVGRTDPASEHMKTYRDVDLCLDSFPYNGTTTTCDSLVMGVPVITLAGDRHASRVTASQMHALGLGALVAGDADQYVDIAAQLATDIEKLDGVRRGLRERMQASPLMDYEGFTRRLEETYRDIWRRWCQTA